MSHMMLRVHTVGSIKTGDIYLVTIDHELGFYEVMMGVPLGMDKIQCATVSGDWIKSTFPGHDPRDYSPGALDNFTEEELAYLMLIVSGGLAEYREIGGWLWKYKSR